MQTQHTTSQQQSFGNHSMTNPNVLPYGPQSSQQQSMIPINQSGNGGSGAPMKGSQPRNPQGKFTSAAASLRESSNQYYPGGGSMNSMMSNPSTATMSNHPHHQSQLMHQSNITNPMTNSTISNQYDLNYGPQGSQQQQYHSGGNSYCGSNQSAQQSWPQSAPNTNGMNCQSNLSNGTNGTMSNMYHQHSPIPGNPTPPLTPASNIPPYLSPNAGDSKSSSSSFDIKPRQSMLRKF